MEFNMDPFLKGVDAERRDVITCYNELHQVSYRDGVLEGLRLGVILASEATSEIKPMICECGLHITGDYIFVDGKYFCQVCRFVGK